MIPALAFVPEDAVEEAFESMTDHISTNIQPIRYYFEETFVGRSVCCLHIWDIYDRTVQEHHRTNNNIEGWHRRFQSVIGGCHPNIWKFLDVLQNYQDLQRVAMTQNHGR